MLFFRRFLAKVIKMKNKLFIWISLLFIFLSSIIIYWIEPETFHHPFNGLWWVMTTLTTVGYGDFYPTTVEGKIFAMFLYITGIGLIGVLIGKFVDLFVIFRERREGGKLKYTGKDHIVILGWSKKAEFAIREILQSYPEQEIVLVDQLEKCPVSIPAVHYVQGDGANEKTLLQANIAASKAAILFADDHIKEPSLADGKSLLISTAIERLAPYVHTTVEIMTEENIQNFKHVKVDDFILSHETISHMAVLSAYNSGVTTVFSQLLSRNLGQDLYDIGKRPHWNTYRDAFSELLQEGATLIAEGNSLNINEKLNDPIPADAQLFIICSKKTYEKIKSD